MYSRFINSWNFTRTLTYDLLSSLDETTLSFDPGEQVGPLWKQFRHLARVQDNYTDGLEKRTVNFGTDSSGYVGGADKLALETYMKEADGRLFAALEVCPADAEIDFYGEMINPEEHLDRLLHHETLHHGQCIMFMRLARVAFPKSWAIWGV